MKSNSGARSYGEGTSPLFSKTDWVAAYDDYGNKYYYNNTTGESSWELPSGGDMPTHSNRTSPRPSRGDTLQYDGMPSARSAGTHQTQQTTWQREFDEENNHHYYVNNKTGTSQWNTPGRQSARTAGTHQSQQTTWQKEFDEENNHHYYVNNKTGTSQWNTPGLSPAKSVARSAATAATSANATVANWHREFDDNTGADFYYNAKTGATQWNTPTRSMNSWQQGYDGNTNQNYYYNSKTGEAKWDTPAKLKGMQGQQQPGEVYEDNVVSPLANSPYPATSGYSSPSKRRTEEEDAPLREAISELVEDESVTLMKKFERLKERSRVLNRFGDSSGMIWLEWEGLGGLGPKFFSIEDELGGQWARPEKASKSAFQNSEQPSNNEHEFGNKLLRKWKVVTQQSNEDVKKKAFQRKVSEAMENHENTSVSGNKVESVKMVAKEAINLWKDNFDSTSLDKSANKDQSRDVSRPFSASAASRKSESNTTSLSKPDTQYSKYYMKAIYQDVIDRDRNIELQFEKEKERLKLDKEELMLMGVVGKKSVRSQLSTDKNKQKSNSKLDTKLVIDTNFNLTVKSDDDSDSDDSYMPDPNKRPTEVTKEINYNLLYSRAVIMKQKWPWICLVDLETDTIFYRNEQEDTFQKETPKVFLQDQKASGSGHSSQPQNKEINNPNPNVKSSGNPLKLLGEFKEEMYYRTAKSAFDRDMGVKETSTAVDRDLPDHAHVDVDDIVAKIKTERSPVDRALLESSALGFEQGAISISSARVPVPAKVRAISRPLKAKPINNSLFSKANTPNLYANKYKASNDQLPSNIPHLPLKVPRTSGTSLTAHISDGKELLKRLRSITDAEFHSQLRENVLNVSAPHRFEPHQLYSTSQFHGQSLIDILQNNRVNLTVNGKKISKAQKQIILQKEYEREENQRLLEKQIIAQQMKSCRDLSTYAIELLDIETPSTFEKEFCRRHLLEAMVTQRDFLKFPFNIRDAKSFSTVSIHTLCPSILTNLDIENLSSNKDGFSTTKSSIDDWNVYTTSNVAKVTPSVIYQCKHSLRTQIGRPFDVRKKLDRDTLARESWQEYEHLLPNAKKHLFAKKVHLLSDRFGGLLYYCPRRDEYSSDGSMKRSLLRKNFVLDTKASIENAEKGLKIFIKPKISSSSKSYGFPHAGSWSKYLESNSFYWKNYKEDLWNRILMQGDEKVIEEKSSNMPFEPQQDTEEFVNYSKALQNLRMSISKAAEQMGVTNHDIKMNSVDNSFNIFPDDSFNRDIGNQINDKFMKNIDDSFMKFQLAEHKSTIGKIDLDKSTPYAANVTQALAGNISHLEHSSVEKNRPQTKTLNFSKTGNDPETEEEKLENLSLQYEDAMHPRFKIQYQELISLIKANDNDPVPIVQLMVFLLERNLGIESLFVYQRALEFISLRSQKVQDDVLSHILAMKLSAKYYGERQSVVSMQTLLKLCPDSASLSAHLARLFYDLRHVKLAETIYVGALIVEPLNPHSLMGYSIMLLENGNVIASLKYLSRIEEDSMYFSFSRLLIAWTQEMIKKDDDAILSTYKVILNHNPPNLYVNSKALSSLGHYYHIRGDFSKAQDYYRRAIKIDSKNMQATLLLAALLATASPQTKQDSNGESPSSTVIPTSKKIVAPTDNDAANAAEINNICKSKELSDNDEEIDSLYRRGYLCSQLSDNDRWIVSLGYAEFIVSHLGDTSRAQTYFEAASKDSFSFSIWSTIALAHYYQYIRDNISNAMNNLQRLLRSRMNIVDSLEESEPLSENLARVVNDENVLSQKLEESSIILCALAYCALDRNNEVEAVTYANQALSIDDKLVAAHRLLATVYYKDKNANKVESGRIHFDRSIKCMNYSNPFCLRSYSIYLVKEKRFEESYQFMESAVKARPHCTLSVRSLAIMTYLFKSSPDDAIILLQRALDLSNGVDMEARRLQGQIYLEIGDHSRARSCFQNVLKVTPLDSISMANLAISLSALGFESAYGDLDNKTPFECYSTYNKRLQNKVYRDVIASEDPFEVFIAAINVNLNGSFQNINHLSEEDFLSIHPEVLFLFGMYLLQRGSIGNLNEAKLYFQRAVKNIDKPTHPIALYMIGWISELCGDLKNAENFYCTSLQFEPIEPLVFLRLSRIASDTRFYVNTLLEKAGKNDLVKRQKLMKNSKSRNLSSKILSSLEIAYYGLNSSTKISSDEQLEDETDVNGLSTLRLRSNLHDRIAKLSDLCYDKKGNDVRGVYSPRRFVLIDPAWADRLYYSFCVCDDWGHLLRGSKSFRDKK